MLTKEQVFHITKDFQFEINDQLTRNSLVNKLLHTYYSETNKFTVICNGDNNPQEIINQNLIAVTIKHEGITKTFLCGATIKEA